MTIATIKSIKSVIHVRYLEENIETPASDSIQL